MDPAAKLCITSKQTRPAARVRYANVPNVDVSDADNLRKHWLNFCQTDSGGSGATCAAPSGYLLFQPVCLHEQPTRHSADNPNKAR